ncbi:MAG: lecithin retinol acyltransferase family protein [Eubacteriales bacterium]
MVLGRLLLSYMVKKVVTDIVDDELRNINTLNEVTPKNGSILICSLGGRRPHNEWHSGIYVGYNQIIELQGNGNIRKVSPEQFKNDGLLRNGNEIYIACNKNGSVLSDVKIAQRAKQKLGSQRNYNVLLDNCHQFSSGCITGDFENANNFKKFLEWTISEELNRGNGVSWCPWK